MVQNMFDFNPVHNPQDAVRAEEAKAEGMARVDAAADELWRMAAHDAALACANRFRHFTSDDVWLELTDENGNERQPRNPKAMGPVMKWLVSQGYTRHTNEYVVSRRVSAHGRPIAVYRSLIKE